MSVSDARDLRNETHSLGSARPTRAWECERYAVPIYMYDMFVIQIRPVEKSYAKFSTHYCFLFCVFFKRIRRWPPDVAEHYAADTSLRPACFLACGRHCTVRSPGWLSRERPLTWQTVRGRGNQYVSSSPPLLHLASPALLSESHSLCGGKTRRAPTHLIPTPTCAFIDKYTVVAPDR